MDYTITVACQSRRFSLSENVAPQMVTKVAEFPMQSKYDEEKQRQQEATMRESKSGASPKSGTKSKSPRSSSKRKLIGSPTILYVLCGGFHITFVREGIAKVIERS